jgi:glycosyltransferase involved in cell wall biosynthesis
LRVLVWQWGRFGAGPKCAALLAAALRGLPGTEVVLSLSRRSDVLRGADPPRCELPVDTYDGLAGFLRRALLAPVTVLALWRRLRALRPDLAVCALPGPLDLTMGIALRLAGVRFLVIVHDADAHPGDGAPLQMWLQRLLCRLADGIGVLSTHVATRVRQQGLLGRRNRALIRLTLPPLPVPVPPGQSATEGLHLLFFGRLLSYKGLDLLADALAALGPRPGLSVRVVGSGPALPVLDRLRALPGVEVENRWVSEDEAGAQVAWADALVLPYREASQSGVAAVALAAGRVVVATDVGGLPEQLGGQPGAILCPPTVEGLTAALRGLLADRPAVPPPAADAQAAWRTMAESLLAQAAPLVRHAACGREAGKADPAGMAGQVPRPSSGTGGSKPV